MTMAKKNASVAGWTLPAYTFIIGSRNRPSGRAYKPKDDKTLAEITARYFPFGFTIIKQQGHWFDSVAGRLVREDSRTIIIATDDPEQIKSWQNEMVFALQQKEILALEPTRATQYNTDLTALGKVSPNL